MLNVRDFSIVFFIYLKNDLVNVIKGIIFFFFGIRINIGNVYDLVYGIFVVFVFGFYNFVFFGSV